MLIDTKSSITYPELRHALGDISVGDYQEVYDRALVCKYVTKHIDKGVDYELTFRHDTAFKQITPKTSITSDHLGRGMGFRKQFFYWIVNVRFDM